MAWISSAACSASTKSAIEVSGAASIPVAIRKSSSGARPAVASLLRYGGGPVTTTRISGPRVLNPVDESARISTNGAAQSGLAAIEMRSGQMRQFDARAVIIAGGGVLYSEAGNVLRAFARKHGIPSHYTDFTAMLAQEKPDIALIATPPAQHVPMSIAAKNNMKIALAVSVPPAVAGKLIEVAKSLGHSLTYDDVYAPSPDDEATATEPTKAAA